MGNDPADDVADPIGGPRYGYERTAVELENLASSIAALLAPVGADAFAPSAVGAEPTSPLRPLQET